MSFRTLASLFAPAGEGRRWAIVEADGRWALDPRTAVEVDVLVWGAAPLRSGVRRSEALRWCLARERGIARARAIPPASLSVAGVHRLPPPPIRPGMLRNRVRDAALGGALLELWNGPRGPRLIDAAAAAAGSTGGADRLHPGSGGSFLAHIRDGEGAARILRLGMADGPGDPIRAAGALEHLAARGVPLVPRPHGRGRVLDVSWTTESLLPGRRPGRVTSALGAEAAAFCARLPVAEEPADAHRQDLDDLARRFPHWAEIVAQAGAACDAVVASVPAVMRHGDLWAGNLLAERGRLTGVIDWDAWHPAALPGTDLLHLVTSEEDTDATLGARWARQPWRSRSYSEATTAYWKALGVRPRTELLDAVGIAWWACQVASTLTRLPRLVDDERWVGQNIDVVLAAVAR